ncbi:MAG: alpha/beta hydrolase [Pararhodobacter sp.]|nr:alpha/beta hydrolase [Pararhodobacter sp.]
MRSQIHIHRQGAGPVLVFLHGWTMAGDIFADAFARLGGQFTCLAPDLPGHGRSAGFSATVEGAAEMLDTLLREDDLREVTLVGWSLGALVGWEYLARFGDTRVRAMVSIDMSPRPLNGDDWDLGLSGQTADEALAKTGWFRDDWPRAARAIARTMFAGTGGAPGLSVAQAEARINAQPAPVMAEFWESLVACDHRTCVRALSVPLLAIHGAQSRVYPPQTADWLARNAPKGTALVLPGAGHAPILEQPGPSCAAIARFATNPVIAL